MADIPRFGLPIPDLWSQTSTRLSKDVIKARGAWLTGYAPLALRVVLS